MTAPISLMPQHCRSFPPIADERAETLVLGSMPGQVSLTVGRYYAHPHNAFWKIMAELFAFDVAASYQAKAEALLSNRIALWDVLQSCSRQGSLDTSIERDSEVPNDFAAFFRVHPNITHVFFNGTKAEMSYRRHVLKKMDLPPLVYARLPSTSPAHAGRSFDQKLEAWRVIVRDRG